MRCPLHIGGDIEQEVGEQRQAREVDVDEEQQAAGMVQQRQWRRRRRRQQNECKGLIVQKIDIAIIFYGESILEIFASFVLDKYVHTSPIHTL